MSHIELEFLTKFLNMSKLQNRLCQRFPLQNIAKLNKTGTSQVGAISKAQKYSRNNYWKHLKRINFFSKKVFFLKKSRTMPKNSKRSHLGSLNVFYKPNTSKNSRGYRLIEFENFRKKVESIVPKKTQRGTL